METDAAHLKALLQSLSTAAAIVRTDDWSIVFENATFFKWFATAGLDEVLTERMSVFDPAAAAAKLEKGRAYTVEVEVTVGPRTLPIAVSMRALGDAAPGLAMLEGVNIAKQREAEYMLDSYSKLAERNARDLQREKERVEKLLLNVMPRSVYEEMKNFGTATPQRFDQASVLMLDFVDFTEMALARDPGGLIAELNDIFTALDRIVELFGCERIKTIGDAYLAVSGLPEANPDHIQNIARVALRVRRYVERRNASHTETWQCRIGINTGPVIGSIVGVQKYVYDIFGPGVNLAARMEALAEPGTILLNEDTYAFLKDDFVCTEMDEVEVKGFGRQQLFRLDGEMSQDRGR